MHKKSWLAGVRAIPVLVSLALAAGAADLEE